MARFEREARLLAALSHPHIAAIHGLEESEGKRFLVLELVEGEMLRARVRRALLFLLFSPLFLFDERIRGVLGSSLAGSRFDLL